MSFVHIRDKDSLDKKIALLRKSGLSELQIVADFDGTLTFHTAQLPTGVSRSLSCHGVIGKHPGFSDNYRNEVQRMEDFFAPLESDPNLDDASRLKVMTDWWSQSHQLMIDQNISINTVEGMVTQACNRGMFGLRLKAREFLLSARATHIPTIVLSAGISLVIEELLKLESIPIDDLTAVVSNQVISGTDGVLQSFVEPVIHGMSKKHVLKTFIDDSVTRRLRKNFIVLGDMPHDADVISSIDGIENVISIGFLLDQSKLNDYLRLYDVVITEDGDFQPVIDLIDRIRL